MVDHGVGTFSYEIILTATDSNGFTDTQSVRLPVNPTNSPFTHLGFTYGDKDELVLAGWDFLARTATGAVRNTEQTGSLAVSYDQTAHPGTLQIPLGSGHLWQTWNNSENTLFRDLPADWQSLRLKVASFSPSANYQQLALVLYQDDDNYTYLNREYSSNAGGFMIQFRQEQGGQQRALAAARGHLLRPSPRPRSGHQHPHRLLLHR